MAKTCPSRVARQGRRRPHRRGVSLIYACLITMLALGLCTLGVDYGHIQIVKTQLQRCADNTARGTVETYLKFGASTAQANAAGLAAANPVDAGFCVQPTVVVTWGYWNSSTQSFVAGTGVPVAVKVDTSRTTAASNPVPLLFPVFSNGQGNHPTCDVLASAVAISNTRTLIDYSGGFSATSPLNLRGTAAVSGTHLRVTTSSGGAQASAAWHQTRVPIGQFNTAFSFQLTSPNGDGFCFVIQNSSATALGNGGGSLGYYGVNRSLAVKFDLYNNAGEGNNSTGSFVNGANPYTPATNLTPSGVDLHAGRVLNCNAGYDGTTLTWTITDPSNSDTATVSSTVNIPALVGTSTAWVGFTGGTGGSTCQADIINWTYSITMPLLTK